MTWPIIPLDENICIDTNVIVHLCRYDKIGRFLDEHYQLSTRPFKPFFCVVSLGEMYSLARRWDWQQAKLTTLANLVYELPPADIVGEAIYFRYAEIDNFAHDNGVKMSKNDLWIAAVSSINSAHLLTCDKDFAVLANYQQLKLALVDVDSIPKD